MVCIPKRLPQTLWKQAHERAFQIEPKNHPQLNRMLSADPKLNLSPDHLAVVTGRRWQRRGKYLGSDFSILKLRRSKLGS